MWCGVAGGAGALAAAAALAIAAGCGSGDTTTAPEPFTPVVPVPAGRAMAEPARQYLDEVLRLMEQNSVRRLELDWVAFRVRVLAAAPGAQSVHALRPAIQEALMLLGDEHSSFSTAEGNVISAATRSCTAPAASVPELPPDVGYVRVGAFSGADGAATVFATAIQDSIRGRDRENLVGWIVDLRGNGGGNMWPMIAGLGPILGDDLLGYFLDPGGASVSWGHRGGTSWLGDFVQVRVESPYRLRRQRPRVAVLTDTRVSSSGEATLIAFRRRPDTRSFGTPTCGRSTANAPFMLGDGAFLNLTVAVIADRARTPYGSSLAPDEVVADPGAAVSRAVAWLRGGE